MSAGLEALLEAAQYLEQQEKLKSPGNGNINSNVITSNNNNRINFLNNNIRHITNHHNYHNQNQPLSVASSAPASVTSAWPSNNRNGSGRSIIKGSKGQLVVLGGASSGGAGQARNNSISVATDYEMSNGTEDEYSSSSLSPNNNNNKAHEQQQQQQCEMEIDVVGDDDDNDLDDDNSSSPATQSTAMMKEQQQILLNVGLGSHVVSSPSVALTIGSSGGIKPRGGSLMQGGVAAMGGVSVGGGAFSLPSTTAMFALQNNNNSSSTDVNATTGSHLNNNNNKVTPKYKTSIPLTPPPMASRKYVDPNARIRSYSLSHKIPASQHHHQLLLQQQQMIVDDNQMGSATTYGSGGSSNGSSTHSPPRYHHHYSLGSQVSTAGSLSSGRRRTISSNSNGAGNRENHNILEKNRRAHLKECYEELKKVLTPKSDESKKTSNLAILDSALKYVNLLKQQDRESEIQVEKLAREKIILTKRINQLKRELGPRYDQLVEIGLEENSGASTVSAAGGSGNGNESTNSSSIPNDKEMSDCSSSSPVPEGGNPKPLSPTIVAAPTAINSVGVPAKLQATGTATTVILKSNISNNGKLTLASSNSNNKTTKTITTSSTIPASMLQQLKAIGTTATDISNGSTTTTILINKNGVANGGSATPIMVTTLPLSLTAKNISATSLTRGSPTPTTPSTPSPTSSTTSSSSSSGVSSSASSLMSSSPPNSGVINNETLKLNGGVVGVNRTLNVTNGIASGGTNTVTVNIPNMLKLQANGGVATIGTTIGNGKTTAAATIIATTHPAGSGVAGNNALMLQALRGCHIESN